MRGERRVMLPARRSQWVQAYRESGLTMALINDNLETRSASFVVRHNLGQIHFLNKADNSQPTATAAGTPLERSERAARKSTQPRARPGVIIQS
jgi:hypothetical protein